MKSIAPNQADQEWAKSFDDVIPTEIISEHAKNGVNQYVDAGGINNHIGNIKQLSHKADGSEEYFGIKKFLHGAALFVKNIKAPEFILESVLQRSYVYSLTAKWGHGKTAIGLVMAVHIAGGKPFAGLNTKQSRVLYMAGENPADVQFRLIAICREFGIDINTIDKSLIFCDKAFPVNKKNIRQFVVEQVRKISEIDLVIIDTGPAHTDIDDENSNTVMQKAAYALRELSEELGSPCVVVMLHPTQGATRENLRSRGGGAFAGQIDGELLLWKHESTKQVEFWHSDKFRGGGFEARWFDLKRVILNDFVDNFGNSTVTVVATHSDRRYIKDQSSLDGNNKVVYEALLTCKKSMTCVTRLEWKTQSLKKITSVSDEAKKKAFDRAVIHLIEKALVVDRGGISGFCLPNESEEDLESC
jgi:hypothetical protein